MNKGVIVNEHAKALIESEIARAKYELNTAVTEFQRYQEQLGIALENLGRRSARLAALQEHAAGRDSA